MVMAKQQHRITITSSVNALAVWVIVNVVVLHLLSFVVCRDFFNISLYQVSNASCFQNPSSVVFSSIVVLMRPEYFLADPSPSSFQVLLRWRIVFRQKQYASSKRNVLINSSLANSSSSHFGQVLEQVESCSLLKMRHPLSTQPP
jgi:hypothetical protein